MDSDESLLRSFAATRDEMAFRALADRYLGLVFHTALRRTGNREIAEEVSQNILCAMARKASSLAGNSRRLPAWLHRATLFESSKAMRAELSYQRRKSLRQPDEAAEFSGDSPWSEAIPHLDKALEKLPEADRAVLLLQFFRQQPFPRIARELGKSTAAVQKQSQRALVKLGRLLGARGATLSATALVAGLSGELAKAAPVHLARHAATAALIDSAALSTDIFSAVGGWKNKALVSALILLCGLPLAFQQIAIGEAVRRNRELVARNATEERRAEGWRDRRIARESKSAWLSGNMDIYRLATEQDEAARAEHGIVSGGTWRLDAFDRQLAAQDDGTLTRLIREAATVEMDSMKKLGLLRRLIFTLGQRNPELALRTAVEAFPGGQRFAQMMIGAEVERAMAAWVSVDSGAALAWLREQRGSAKFFAPGVRKQSGLEDPFRQLEIATIRAMFSEESPRVAEILSAIDRAERKDLLKLSLMSPQEYSKSVRLGSLGSYRRKPDREESSRELGAAIRAIREFIPEIDRPELIKLAGRRAATGFLDVPTLAEIFGNPLLTADERQTMAIEITRPSLSKVAETPGEEARQAEMRSWLEEISPGKVRALEGEMRTRRAAEDARIAEMKIGMLRERVNMTDDQLVSELTELKFYSSAGDIPAALEIALRIKDAGKRAQVIKHLKTN